MGIDYKALIINKLGEAADKNPDLSFSEILYSVLRKENLKTRDFEGSVYTKFLLDTEDKDFYSAVNNFIKKS